MFNFIQGYGELKTCLKATYCRIYVSLKVHENQVGQVGFCRTTFHIFQIHILHLRIFNSSIKFLHRVFFDGDDAEPSGRLRSYSMDSLLDFSPNSSMEDVGVGQMLQSHQTFIGMVSLQYQAIQVHERTSLIFVICQMNVLKKNKEEIGAKKSKTKQTPTQTVTFSEHVL